MAIAACIGLLATAVNLLPIGQLDGGHILYALVGEKLYILISRVALVLLALAGLRYYPWLVWAVLLFFFRRHPYMFDQQPLNMQRKWLGALALVLLLLTFAVAPIRLA